MVVRYLGRYTHRIALSNHRIRNVANGKVAFSWKDYRKDGKKGMMTLSATEFLRRFCLHILPPHFVRLRHYGILSSRNKTKSLADARQDLSIYAPEKPQTTDWKILLEQVIGLDVDACPCCKTGSMQTIRTFGKARSPPVLPILV